MTSNAQTDIELAVEYAKQGTNPLYITQLESGWVFLGLNQVLRGCCFLVADPHVSTIEDLSPHARAQYIDDMIVVGKAIQAVTGASKINYLFLGNKDPILHVHIIPRFDDEPDQYKAHGPWKYDEYVKFDIERDQPLIDALRTAIENRETVETVSSVPIN